MPLSQSLDIGASLQSAKKEKVAKKTTKDVKEDVEIKPATDDTVKEYDQAQEELETIPKVEFEKGKRKELPSWVYLVVLLLIALFLAWLLYKPSPALPEKNATALAEALKQGLA